LKFKEQCKLARLSCENGKVCFLFLANSEKNPEEPFEQLPAISSR
jgi:hypothetical protein